jgi:hypothetical protein
MKSSELLSMTIGIYRKKKRATRFEICDEKSEHAAEKKKRKLLLLYVLSSIVTQTSLQPGKKNE